MRALRCGDGLVMLCSDATPYALLSALADDPHRDAVVRMLRIPAPDEDAVLVFGWYDIDQRQPTETDARTIAALLPTLRPTAIVAGETWAVRLRAYLAGAAQWFTDAELEGLARVGLAQLVPEHVAAADPTAPIESCRACGTTCAVRGPGLCRSCVASAWIDFVNERVPSATYA